MPTDTARRLRALEAENRRLRRRLALADPAPGGGPRPRFVVRLLGAPSVLRRDATGERELRWRLRRALHVLAYLASAPEQRATKEELVEALWPDADAATIQANFHPTLSSLRRTLGEGAGFLLAAGGVYRLGPAAEWEIDVVEFERHAAAGRAALDRDAPADAVAAWEAAWRLYRGPFLTSSDDLWAVAVRTRCQQRYGVLLRQLGALYERLGRRDDAVDVYRLLLHDDPLQEDLQLELMRVLARQGRRDLVRRQYERLSRQLRDELGVEPLLETTLEYHRLLSQGS